MPNNVRMQKINSEIQKSLSEIISNLNNPELENLIISITRVDTSNDLYVTRAYVSILGDSNSRERVMAILSNAKGYVRRELAHKVQLRTVPDLVFVLDDSQDYSANINRLLDKINKGN